MSISLTCNICAMESVDDSQKAESATSDTVALNDRDNNAKDDKNETLKLNRARQHKNTKFAEPVYLPAVAEYLIAEWDKAPRDSLKGRMRDHLTQEVEEAKKRPIDIHKK